MKFFVFLFAFAMSASFCFADQEFPMPQSISPDGRYSMVFLSHLVNQETGETQGQIALKNEKTGKSTVFLDDTDYFKNGDYASYIDVMWSPNGQFVAIAWATTHGYVSCHLFRFSENNKSLTPIISPDYGAAIFKKGRENKNLKVDERMGDKGGEHPLKWISNSRLLLDVSTKALFSKDGGYDSSDYREHFNVTIHISKSVSNRKPVVKIEKVEWNSSHS